jgi:hypothetical protein
MATNTILQKLDGETDFGASASNRRQVETFVANDTIAAGDVVSFDASKTGADRVLFVVKAGLVANGNGLCCGVALVAASAGESVQCVIAGYAEVTTHGSVAQANLLTASGTSAGTVDGRVAGDIAPAFGITLEARTGSGLVAAWIYKSF